MARRIALYLRVSTAEQDCERQERDLRQWCERQGWQVVAVRAEQASGAKASRKERAALIAMAKRRELDAIAVTELSRWGRSVVDLIHTVQQLGDYGAGLLCLNGTDLDPTTATGKLMFTVLAAIAEFERELLRERTISGLRAARARGVKLGRRAGSNPAQKRYGDKVSELRALGLSIRQVATSLRISPTTVQAILKSTAEKSQHRKAATVPKSPQL